MKNIRAALRSLAVALAVLLLNASVTFYNVWPTPAVRWQHDLSMELAILLLILAFAVRRVGPLSKNALRWLSALWIVMVIGHYGAVTAPGLYGRPVNLFWDIRHISALTGMLAEAAARRMVVAAALGSLLLLFLLYAGVRWTLGIIAASLTRNRDRWVLCAVSALALLVWIGQQFEVFDVKQLVFSEPVAKTYWRQTRLISTALLGASPVIKAARPIQSDLAHVQGADVLLIFMESYGAVTYDRPEFAAALAAPRSRFEEDVKASGRSVISAFVESPTFGGSSWLAHVSLMSGVEARDEDTNVLLMAQKRETMVTAFSRHGYRTIALMPGIRQAWPEGGFYGFDKIYGFDQLEYQGPAFGWWAIPDQYSLARIDAVEPSTPRFLFFPTSGTHTPFGPTPPYQPDWDRLLTREPFAEPELATALALQPDLLNLRPSYLRALSYTFETLGGYLRHREGRDLVMILIGDHQPPAAVSGRDARWDVPVHIIASRPKVIESLLSHGFSRGMTPAKASLGPMHQMFPTLFEAFGEPTP